MNQRLTEYQEKMKDLFDQNAKGKEMQVRNLVLRWDIRRVEKGKHGKFNPLWFGPLKIAEEGGDNNFRLENLQGDLLEAPVNRKFLKPFFQY